MLKRNYFVLPNMLLLLTLSASLPARAHVSLMAGAVPLSPLAHVTLDTDRDRDGLSGPVRRIKTETAKLLPKGGQLVEGPRQMLETASYDLKGAKIDYAFFPMATDSLTGKEVYKYDDQGNISEMTLLSAAGSVLSKETYQYEFDKLGNWTKMTTLLAIIENGQVMFEPKDVTYRSITYYLEESVAKMLQPGNNALATASAAITSPSTRATVKPSLTPVKMGMAAKEAPINPMPNSATANSIPANHVAAGNVAAKKPAADNATSSATNNAVQPASSASITITESSAAPLVAGAMTAANLTLPTTDPPPPPVNRNTAAPLKTEAAASTKPLKDVPVKLISGGVLNGKALELPKPAYPEIARRARTFGLVSVEVVIDLDGQVISAKAVSGPSLLQRAAEAAALKARFTPTLLSGQPVKMTGTISYNFSF